MDLGLKGKKAIITGGATGIGKAIAIDLAKEGVSVAITSRDQKSILETLAEINKYGCNHYSITINITEPDGPALVAEEIKKKFGNPDIIVNNIGGTLQILDPYCPISDWRRLFRLNLEVAIEINNQFLPHMKKQDWGRIVNVSAGASMENSGPVPYCTSKAALTAYTRCMGRVLATECKNVVMSAVLPGVVLTERGDWARNIKERPEHAEKYLKERCPLGRFGKPSEISPVVVLLCSELATFCQGSIMPVDAGQARHFFQVRGLCN